MGKSIKRRRNLKARSGGKEVAKAVSVETKSKVPDIPIELEIDPTKYDSANPLILPGTKSVESDKHKKSDVRVKKQPKKALSHKKKKKLEKVLQRKKRIQDRSAILEELKKHQLDAKSYSVIASTSGMHSKSHKRSLDNSDGLQLPDEETVTIKTYSKRKRVVIDTVKDDSCKLGDDVLGFENSDDEASNDEDEEEETEVVEAENNTIKPKEYLSNDNKDTEEKEESTNSQDQNSKCDEIISDKVTEEKEKKPSEEPKKVDSDSVGQKNADESACSTVPASSSADMKTRFVPVNRDPAIEEIRANLPIINEEQTIMETIRYNDVTILCGETGSGKTTQIPQFLYEAGYAVERKIGITEPRRVAAIAMSQRVAHEMNLSSDIVSYQIRFEGNYTEQTKIKFMTDGILLKEIQKDLLLSSYSVIIIDEAHERTVYSDILIGLLSRVINLRAKKEDPLKLIIMSATLRIDDFTSSPNLFKSTPPVIKIESRQFPVSIHFNKVTPDDYIHEAYTKVCKIHQNMPKAGGILVFLTGQQEVITLCQKLRRTFPLNEDSVAKQKEKQEEKAAKKLSRKEAKKLRAERKTKPQTLDDIMPQIDLDSYGHDIELGDDASDDEGIDESSDEDENENVVSCSDPLYCLPLFSHLNEKRQKKIFENPPEGVRLCVVATNIAETSLTIPNIKYVIDTGKVKMKYYDQTTGISTFFIDWTSKASADQRAGRAGRMGPGHCYRLYSSAVFKDNFKDFSDPEIVRKPIDDLVLQMKSMNIENVANFPFPTPPSIESVIAAENRLVLLGALKETKIAAVSKPGKSKSNNSQTKSIKRITPLGRIISFFPLSPRFAKMLIVASKYNLIHYGVSIVSALTVQEIFISQMSIGHVDDEEGTKATYKDKHSMIRKRWAGTGNSLLLGDMMIFLCAVGAWEHVECTPAFCSKYGLRLKAMNEIRKLRHQLLKEISVIFPQLELSTDLKMLPPTDAQAKRLRQVILSGLFDHVARSWPEDEKNDENKRQLKNAYKSIELEKPVFISTNSVLYDIKPQWVVYQEIYETQKLYMREVVAIDPEWLPIYAPNMCTFSKPMDEPMPRYDSEADCVKCTVQCTFGPHGWILPDTEIEYPESIDKYRWFVRFLLEGHVVNYFASRRSLLLSTPAIMQKSWAKLQKRTEIILTSLAASKICTRKNLLLKWSENPNYLLNEFLKWIPEAYHLEIQSEWPPLPKSSKN